MTIQSSELSEAITEILESATEELKTRIDEAGEAISADGVKTLKATSPVRAGNTERTGSKGKSYRPGAYARSWKYDRNYNAITGNSKYTVYNDWHYRLTHLLENGHVNRDGTRTRKFVHIAPVNDKMSRNFEKKVEDAIHEM